MKRVEYSVRQEEAGWTLQAFLTQRLALSRNRAKQRIDQRDVFVNGRRVWMARHNLRRGDRVEVHLTPEAPDRPAPAAVPILYEDPHYLVADKPAGILSNGPDSLELQLRKQTALPSLAAVHRLDRDTSGCLLYAKTADALQAGSRLFLGRSVKKMYHAIAAGQLRPAEQSIRTPVDGQPAITHFKVLDSSPVASHLLVKIETGRTHQIRKHLAAARHPVLGDHTYGGRIILPEPLRGIARQMLHAQVLEFEHPITCRRIRVTAPLPRDFMHCLHLLRLT